MNKRSKNTGVLLWAVVLVLFWQSPAYAQTTESPGATPAPATPSAEAQPTAPTAATPPVASTPAPGAKVIYVNTLMRYAEGAPVDNAVINECQLPQQGMDLLESAARNVGISFARDDVAVKSAKGRIFVVEIVNVVSTGNAFTGHSKQVSVRGRLLDGGKEIAVFNGTRASRGGFGGGFKSSCTVLVRCLEALSRDTAGWLRAQAL